MRLGCVRDLRWVDWEPLSEAGLVPSGEKSCLLLLRVHELLPFLPSRPGAELLGVACLSLLDPIGSF